MNLKNQWRIFLGDLSTTLTKLLKNQIPDPHQPITLAHPQPKSLATIVKAIARRLGRSPLIVAIPWRFVYLVLKSLETIGMPQNFKSDSVLSFIHQNPNPDFRYMKQHLLVSDAPQDL